MFRPHFGLQKYVIKPIHGIRPYSTLIFPVNL